MHRIFFLISAAVHEEHQLFSVTTSITGGCWVTTITKWWVAAVYRVLPSPSSPVLPATPAHDNLVRPSRSSNNWGLQGVFLGSKLLKDAFLFLSPCCAGLFTAGRISGVQRGRDGSSSQSFTWNVRSPGRQQCLRLRSLRVPPSHQSVATNQEMEWAV